MTGIRTGTRLERLEELQRATRLQRAYARWRQDTAEHDRLDRLVTAISAAMADEHAALAAAARARPEVATGVRRTDDTVTAHLAALGVSARDVKQWAVAQGLIPAVVRGRVSGLLVDAYDHAHQKEDA